MVFASIFKATSTAFNDLFEHEVQLAHTQPVCSLNNSNRRRLKVRITVHGIHDKDDDRF